MTMLFNTQGYPFKLSSHLFSLLGKEVGQSQITPDGTEGITLCFRDEKYSPELGGFHPVEIRLIKSQDQWKIDYITDFSYVGMGYNAELVKEIDFDFSNDCGYQMFSGEHPLKQLTGLYHLWEENFLSYVGMGVFKVTVYG